MTEKNGLKMDPRYKYLEKYEFFSKSIFYGIYLYTLGPIVALVRGILFVLLYALSSVVHPHFFFNVAIPLFRILFCIKVNIKRNTNEEISTDEIIVSNHSCYKDFLTIMTCLKRKEIADIIIPTKLLFPNTIKKLKFVEVSFKKSTDEIKQQLNKNGNILIFPEGSFNDGTYAYKFYKHVFSLNRPIRPVALKIKFCCGHYMRMHDASWFSQLYAIFSIPCVEYDVYILDKMSIKDGESDIEFAERCRLTICNECNVKPIDYIFKNIKEIM